MSKHIEPVHGLHYAQRSDGVIVVGQPCPNILAPYDKDREVPHFLSLVDHALKIKKRKQYEGLLKQEQCRFKELALALKDNRLFLHVVLQGRDASGKSGVARCISDAVKGDPRMIQVIGIGRPSQDDLEYPYLHRFFKDAALRRAARLGPQLARAASGRARG